MAYQLIDQFSTFDTPTQDPVNYYVYINTVSPYNISVSTSGYGIEVFDLSTVTHNRSFLPGDTIYEFCDVTSRVKAIADNSYPFAITDVTTNSIICGYNGGGGPCTLYIARIDVINQSATGVNDGSAQVIPANNLPADVLEFSGDNMNWQSDNSFFPLSPGIYTAYVRDQNLCSASLSFQIFAASAAPLTINSIVTTDEQSEGAADGTAIINASSALAPIEYSINNVNWQAGNQFLNLAPGMYTAYVRDAGLVVVQQLFEIQQFSGFINQEPKKAVNNVNTSRWNAAFNPIVFKFQRKDYFISSILSDPGIVAPLSPMLILNVVPEGIEVGGSIYVSNSIYNGIYKILSFNSNTITLNTPYLGVSGTGFILANAKINYRIELMVITNAKEIIIGTFTNDPSGLITCNVQSKLKNLLKNSNDFQYNQINWHDVFASAPFSVSYREVWDANLSPVWVAFPGNYYATNSAKQIAEKFGGNMAEYVPFADGIPQAKFLTYFKNPTYFEGYPFDLSFIYSEHLTGLSLRRLQNFLNINQEGLYSGDVFLANEDETLLLHQDDELILVEENSGAVPMSGNTGIHRLMLSTPVFFSKYVDVSIDYIGGVNITETKRIVINRECRNNPVYLAWLNTLGGWDYYLFDITQKVSLGVGNIKTFERYIEDYEAADGLQETFSKDAEEKITIGANNILNEDVKAIRGIVYSTKVLLLIGQNPVKWLTVQVDANSFTYETGNSSADVEFSIVLPQINIQTN